MSEPLTCDTSVLVPALTAWHPDHQRARAALTDVVAVPAHVLLECCSVLTRLPQPHRIAPSVAAAAVAGLSWPTLALPGERLPALLLKLAEHNIAGGAAYDGLVAATALHHGYALRSADQRARRTYDVVGVRVLPL